MVPMNRENSIVSSTGQTQGGTAMFSTLDSLGFIAHVPQAGHPVLEMVDMDHIRNCPLSRVVTFRDSVLSARRTIETSDGAIRSMQMFCMDNSGDIVLIRVGNRGGVRRLWNFTRGRR